VTTWQQIFAVDPPVRGELSQFTIAKTTFETMRDDAQNVVDQFANFADPAFVDGHLNDAPGAMVTEVLSQADGGLKDLPRIADEASQIFSDHYDRLAELREEADGALARAHTAWLRKSELLAQQSNLQSQIDGLSTDIDDADPDADTGSLEDELSGAESSLGSVNGELESVQNTLDGIYGGDDGEWHALANAEHDRNEATVDALNDIDLGSLKDPGFWDKLVSAVGGFVLGVLESVANLLEALVTGDLATFLWELKSLLDAALLVLGTIALFTGIGAPLFFLAVASFAVTTTLWATQTPNPQTGETMGLGDVAWSAAGVALSSFGAIRNMRGPNGMRLFTQTTTLGRAANGRYATVLSGTRAPGALRSMADSVGHVRTIVTAPRSAHGAWTQLAKTPWARNLAYRGSTPLQQGLLRTDAVVHTAWQAHGVVGNVYNRVPGADNIPVLDTVMEHGFNKDGFGAATGNDYSGWNTDGGYATGVGGPGNFGEQGTPWFGPGIPPPPPPTRLQVLEVAEQVRQSPDVVIKTAGP
jgi:hypothetical protein